MARLSRGARVVVKPGTVLEAAIRKSNLPPDTIFVVTELYRGRYYRGRIESLPSAPRPYIREQFMSGEVIVVAGKDDAITTPPGASESAVSNGVF